MFPTVEDVVYIYARACRAWYKEKAPEVAREKIAELKQQGDQHGADMWTKLEQEINRT